MQGERRPEQAGKTRKVGGATLQQDGEKNMEQEGRNGAGGVEGSGERRETEQGKKTYGEMRRVRGVEATSRERGEGAGARNRKWR